MTATEFSGELNLAAIALIDHTVKVFEFKESSTRSQVEMREIHSFKLTFIATCLFLATYARNSRPILCCGSGLGDVALYYLDSSAAD